MYVSDCIDINAKGHLTIGGADTVELAEKFGTPAYVLDEENVLYKNLNKEMISLEKVENKYDIQELKGLIEAHVAATGSAIGKRVLDDFDNMLPHFKKLIPHEYKKVMSLSTTLEEKGLSAEEAQMEAFLKLHGEG